MHLLKSEQTLRNNLPNHLNVRLRFHRNDSEPKAQRAKDILSAGIPKMQFPD
ncbi:hypothetical protein PC116_g3513 [Phytophthora cactorum]|uniref:Uncharacterized protein n=1 Tax=Phytophthora cactorum TaxID=29920 RepID=A0A8T1E4C6_9STRA|nr:hypothetical protein PC117_g5457 [Phytophthora cactorum]KAG3033195.1 hypothetical protein PC119_g5374 [Phytophthora cactorum]KAG3180064.1 hypothetical protein C6341_g7114 [Phytophthora cactorum]KAG3202151.1 hypothetical protein PC128_g3377 [Phytophthora cactorum]KAG4248744.1 hypothetical protein PC116_g3513 [Phytophthora cactorum]